MAYPTALVAANQTTGSSWPPTALAASVGDLCILTEVGNTTFQAAGAPTGGDSGNAFTLCPKSPASDSSSGRIRVWYKVLTSGDISSGNVATFTSGTASGVGRLIGGVFHHANGWDLATTLVEDIVQNTNVSNGSSIATLTNKARQQVVMTFFWIAAGQNGVTFTWDNPRGVTAGLTAGSSTAAGSALATDVGETMVSGGNIPANTLIGSVVVGTSWSLVDASGNPVNAINTTSVAVTIAPLKLTHVPYVDENTGTTTDGGGTWVATQPGTDGHHYGTNTNVAQADFWLYDTNDTPRGITEALSLANTTHIAYTVNFQTQGPPTKTGTALISGGGTLGATGTTTVPGTATIVGGGNAMHANGTRVGIGTLSITGGGTLTAAQQGVAHITGTANFAGNGTLSAVGAPLVTGTMQITGGGTHQAFGLRTVVGTSLITGGGTFHLDQRHDVTVYTVGGTWSSSSQNVAGGRTWQGTAGFQGHGTFTAAGVTLTAGHGDARLNGIATLRATGIRTVFGTASFSNSVDFELKPLNLTNSDRVTLDHSSRLTLDTSSRITIDG